MNSYNLSLLHTGTVIEEDNLTLGQLCRACGTTADWIISLVEEGIIEPLEKDMRAWYFSGASLMRARSALKLQQDLGINLTGVSLVLDLMDELETLCAQIKLTGNA
ncbi:MAG: MerR family transcriptional regulator [Methylococcales bacterium]|nr:MerR family transcriptional regulator [Methylococcales bacterium]